MFARKVVEGQEGIGILCQAMDGLWALGPVLGLKRGDSPLGILSVRRSGRSRGYPL